MKQHALLNSLILSGTLLLTTTAFSHPFDSPLTFIKHKTNDGRVIYTNIPKKCFSNGVLHCADLHPVLYHAKSKESPEHSDTSMEIKEGLPAN